ncbi:MAG: RNA polymerase sigma factor [Microthrixaceae bacterium]
MTSPDPDATPGNPHVSNRVATDVTTAVATPPGSDVKPIADDETGDQIFTRLVLPEVDVMWRVAMSLTRNRADAEDLVQESLLRAYRAIHTFDGRYPRAWLLTIVRNTERNRHRRRRPELLSDPNIAEERGPATEPDDVERYAEDREFDAAVTASLEELPENFRRVIELVDVDGLTYQEAADLLEVPLGTVMSRLHRARRRIRELLVPLGYGPSRSNNEDAGAVQPDGTVPTTSASAPSAAEGRP